MEYKEYNNKTYNYLCLRKYIKYEQSIHYNGKVCGP